MFEVNENLEVKQDYLLGSKIFTIDNFYKDPEEVSEYIFNREVPLWKLKRVHHLMVYFNERRLIEEDGRLKHLQIFKWSVVWVMSLLI